MWLGTGRAGGGYLLSLMYGYGDPVDFRFLYLIAALPHVVRKCRKWEDESSPSDQDQHQSGRKEAK